jgi:hypothetical protein
LCCPYVLEQHIKVALDAMQHSRELRGRELAETLAPGP